MLGKHGELLPPRDAGEEGGQGAQGQRWGGAGGAYLGEGGGREEIFYSNNCPKGLGSAQLSQVSYNRLWIYFIVSINFIVFTNPIADILFTKRFNNKSLCSACKEFKCVELAHRKLVNFLLFEIIK